MGNINFEIPCADRKTRQKRGLDKYDRKKLFEYERNPRDKNQLNKLENYIQMHEKITIKNSAMIENTNTNNKTFSMNDPLSTYDSNVDDACGLKVCYLSEISLIDFLNHSLTSKVFFFYTFSPLF